MTLMTSRASAKRTSLTVICACATSPALAAAPIYFDIGGLLLYGLVAILGLLVFPACFAFSKSKEARRTFAWLSIACIVGLAVPVVTSFSKTRQLEDGVLADAEAFARYCKGGPTVLQPEAATQPALVRVRHEPAVGHPNWIGGAAWLARRVLADQGGMCTRSRIAAFAPETPGAGEQALYSTCSTTVAAPDAHEYELLVRDSHEQRSGTGQVPWGKTVMYKSTLVLTRVQDKRTVAQGDFFFVNPPIVQIAQRCPRSDDEAIRDFLAAALPRS